MRSLNLQVDGILRGSLIALDTVHSSVHDVLELVGSAWTVVQRVVFVVVLHVIA